MIIKNKNIVVRNIHDTYFLIDIKEIYLNNKCSLYELNDIGYLIWQLLDSHNSISDIAKSIFNELSTQARYEDVYNDIDHFIHILLQENFLEETNGRNQ